MGAPWASAVKPWESIGRPMGDCSLEREVHGPPMGAHAPVLYTFQRPKEGPWVTHG